MTELLPVCPEQTTLTSDERAQLEKLPDGAHELENDVPCELQKDHQGSHAALGQICGADENGWWLVWSPGTRELAYRESCPARSQVPDVDGDVALCQLAVKHSGAHSFLLEEERLRKPSREYRRRLAAVLREDLDPEQRACLEEMEAQIAEPGPLLSLFTGSEALVLAVLLKAAGEADFRFEDLAETLSERMEKRLEEQLGEDGAERLEQRLDERMRQRGVSLTAYAEAPSTPHREA